MKYYKFADLSEFLMTQPRFGAVNVVLNPQIVQKAQKKSVRFAFLSIDLNL